MSQSSATGQSSGEDGQSFAERLEVCGGCHGADGISEMPEIPSLAGQPAEFLLIQLFVFREGLRPETPMTAYARDLTDDDLRAFSEHYAGLKPPRALPYPEKPLYERGAEIATQQRCARCHLPDYTGEDTVPRLVGQREDYLVMTLHDYKSGKRPGYEPTMAEVLSDITPSQIEALAHFVGHHDG